MSTLRRRTPVAVITAGLCAVTLISACAATEPSDADPSADSAAPTVQDWTGTTITLESPAERIICLDGTCLDALTELGLAPVAALEHDTATHPAFFGPDAEIEALGGTFFEPDLEGIIAAEPDLVVGSANVHGNLREALGAIPFYGHSFSNDEAGENLERLGELTGRTEEATAAVAHWQQVLEDYRPDNRATSVLSMYGGATQDVGIDAADSPIGSLLARYTDYPWPAASEGDSGFLELSLEEVLTVDPIHIWVLDFGFDPDAPPLVESLADNPAWVELTAVRTDNVHIADAAWWGTAAGTRAQQLTLDTVLPTLYPEEFPAPLSGLPQP